MENTPAYLFAFRRLEDGSVLFLGDHGAFISGEILITPMPKNERVDILIFLITIRDPETRSATVELNHAM